MFYKEGVLKNFAKFTGKGLWQSHFCNKNAGLEKILAKFLRTVFLIEHRTLLVAASKGKLLNF